MTMKKVGFPKVAGKGAPPAEVMPMGAEGEAEVDTEEVETEVAEPEPQAGGFSDMVISAVEEGLADVTDPKEVAQVLRDLADMVEGGEMAGGTASEGETGIA